MTNTLSRLAAIGSRRRREDAVLLDMIRSTGMTDDEIVAAMVRVQRMKGIIPPPGVRSNAARKDSVRPGAACKDDEREERR